MYTRTVIALCLFHIIIGIKRYSSGYLDGYYCLSDYFKTTTVISPHICTLLCMASARCHVLAYNYKLQLCSLGQKPCVIAKANQDHMTMVLRDSVDQDCLVWNQWDGSSDLPRATRSDKSVRSVARKVQGNNIYPGSMNAPLPGNGGAFFAIDGSEIMFLDAELLSVHPNCSLAWMQYTVGEPLPKRAVVIGNMEGRNVYSTRVDFTSDQTFGYYVEGDPAGYYCDYGGRESFDFDILIHVWWKYLNCLRPRDG